MTTKASSAHLNETQIDSTVMFKGHLLELRCDRVRLPDGQASVREYVKHQGAVVIIPLLDNGDMLFERQFRYPLQKVLVEFPAGKIDPGEDFHQTARRELLEETGYVADNWRHLGQMHPCVGYADEQIEIFLARNLRQQSAQQLDCGEFLDVFTMSLAEAIEAVRLGEITDSKTITALFWVDKVLNFAW